jgi:hypothetical protein
MSESATAEKVKEKVTYVGTVSQLVEKKNGWYSVEISVPGKQYPIKADTKLEHLLVNARRVRDSGAVSTFVLEEWDSDNISEKSGKPFRERRLSSVEEGSAPQQPPNASAGSAAPSTVSDNSGGMSKDEWAQKDSAIHMMAAIKAAADTLKHTVPSDPTSEDLQTFLERCKTLSYSWWLRAEAVRNGDDRDVPFLSEHDDSLPF